MNLVYRSDRVMDNPLFRKLSNFARFSHNDVKTLDSLARTRARRWPARDELAHEGDAPLHLFLVLAGWAMRHKTLENGRRQILAFFLPGDLCDLHITLLGERDHSIGALSTVTAAELTPRAIDEAMTASPRIADALRWETLVNHAIQREWTVNLGQRTALERIAHLLVELHERLRAVGLAAADGCNLPLTQTDIADATGLTAVHVNRTLQELRGRGLIRLKSGMLSFPDLAALKRLALFNGAYLHLGRVPADGAGIPLPQPAL